VQLSVDVSATGKVVMGTCESAYSYGSSVDCEKRGVYNVSLSTTGMFVADDGLNKDKSEAELDQMSFYRMKFYADDITIAGQGTMESPSWDIHPR
jgi:hypothetical protein